MSTVTEEFVTEEFRTDNMALAAFLIQNDITLCRAEWHNDGDGRRGCYWTFEDSEELANLVTDFVGGLASVEPQKFNRIMGDLKHRMFRLPGAPDGKRR